MLPYFLAFGMNIWRIIKLDADLSYMNFWYSTVRLSVLAATVVQLLVGGKQPMKVLCSPKRGESQRIDTYSTDMTSAGEQDLSLLIAPSQ
jgi:hypothetical protein